MNARRSGYRIVLPAVGLAALFMLAGLSQPQEPQSPKPARESSSVRGQSATDVAPATDRLTSKPCPDAAPPPTLKVGDTIETGPAQRRRVLLEGGVILYVNQDTKLKYAQPNHVALSAGEIAVDVPRRPLGDGGFAVFGIATPHKDLGGNYGLWAVRCNDKGSSISVVRGAVKIAEDQKQVIVSAGQELRRDRNEPTPLPRASHVLDWTKDLMAAAASPLVPGSQHAGGALVARDPDGQEAKISLRKFHVDVHIEDGFARTTIDQTYFNQESLQLEGTFYFPLPPDASLSRLAMYVDGNLMEGGMAERDHARQVYETIRYANRDPALLEWVDGSTFKMRVFPLEPRQEKRIILSYTQKLPSLYGQTTYRFPAGHTMQKVDVWSFLARVKNGAELAWNSPSHPDALKPRNDGADLLLQAFAKDARTDKDVILSLTEKQADDTPRFASAVHDGAQYLMLRYRPKLQLPTPNSELRTCLWVFLFDASGDRDPLLGRAQIEVIRNLLTHVEPSDQFLVATANTRIKYASAKPQAATAENIKAAVEFLDNAHLIGALDLGNAFAEITKALPPNRPQTHLIHVGTGLAAMGEQHSDALVKALPAETRYVGVGVGRRWNRAFMKAAAEKTGGHFTQINPDEPIAWRAFDLFATLNTPRLMNVQVAPADGPEPRFLTMAESIAQGEEICALARIGNDAKRVKTIQVTGTVAGKPFKQVVKLADETTGAGYLPRTWAKLEIDRLLAENPLKHKKAIVELSKAMYVMTPFTSLLVLENEDMYTQYKVDRGRKDHWAMYDLPAKIPVVFEPDPNAPDPKSGKLRAKQVAQTVHVRARPGFFAPSESRGPQLLANVVTGMYAPVGFGARLDGVDKSSFALPLRGADPSAASEFGLELGLQSSAFFAGKVGLIRNGEEILRQTREDQLADFALGAPPADERLFVRESEGAFRDRLAQESRAEGPRGFVNLDGSILGRTLPHVAAAGLTPAGSFTPDLNIPIKSSSFEFGIPLGEDWNGIVRDQFVVNASGPKFVSTRGGVNQAFIADDGFVLAGGVALRKTAKESRARPISFDDLVAGTRANASLLYKRPAFSGDLAIFYDLVAYCPGLNTSAADLGAVLEAEAHEYVPPKLGDVDASARELLGRARGAGWQTWTREGKDGEPALTVTFDGTGRFVCERVLPFGLKEQIVCDGKTLWHLYPQLQIGAKRTMTPHHRAALAALIPWCVPPVDDLARNADIRLAAGSRSIMIVPHYEAKLFEYIKEVDKLKKSDPKKFEHLIAPEWHRVHLSIADDGRLLERQIVRMPAHEVVARQFVERDGRIRVLDEKGKEVLTIHGKLSSAEPPSLTPQTKGLVVLPLPYRSAAHVQKSLKMDKRRIEDLRFEEGLHLFAAHVGSGNGDEAQNVFQRCFHVREQRQLGFYVFLAACKRDNADAILSEYPDEPLAQYLAVHSSPVLRKHAAQWAINSVKAGDGFLQHLGLTHALYQRWESDRVLKTASDRLKVERQRAFDYVKKHKDSAFGWGMLCLLEDRAAEARAAGTERLGTDTVFYRDLADAFRLFADSPALGYPARYEEARCTLRASAREEAKKGFHDLYADTFKKESLPLVDPDFRRALLGKDSGADWWSEILRRTAKHMIDKKNRAAVLALAWQCWQLDDQPMANQLFTMALDGVKEHKERRAMLMAGIDFLWHTSQVAQADDLVKELQRDKELAKRPGLWRLGEKLAAQREQTDRGLECLERALEMEYAKLPPVIDLQKVRAEYGKLLGHYEKLAEAMVTLRVKPSPEFLAKVVRAADRWRALDRDSTDPATKAAWILQRLGERELGWDYLTTPLALKPNEAEPWVTMATNLARKGDLDLADRAYKAAFDAESTNAQILWDRALNLRRLGKTVEAQALFRRIADGTWQPRFQGLQNQARAQLQAP